MLGRNINLDVKRIIAYRQFCNKIWNSFKLSITKVDYNKKYDLNSVSSLKLSFTNQWILSKLNGLIFAINNHFENYEFGEAANKFHAFWLYDFCDVYIETAKNALYGGDSQELETTNLVLLTILENGLKLLHPMMPFLTEELYQKLPQTSSKVDSITIAPFPTVIPSLINKEVENQFNELFGIIRTIRSLISSVNLPSSVKPKVFAVMIESDEKLKNLIQNNEKLIMTLAKISEVIFFLKKSS